MAACAVTHLPSRENPHELGVMQSKSKDAVGGNEYVFCDIEGGAWGCSKTTLKTPVNNNVTDDSLIGNEINQAVKSVVENITLEQPVPSSEPIFIIYFDFDSDFIDSESKRFIYKVIQEYSSSAKYVEIHGFTDSIGTVEYNNSLSLKRAKKVKELFERKGFPSERVKAYGHGLCCYVKSNNSNEHRSRNRRVEIYITDY